MGRPSRDASSVIINGSMATVKTFRALLPRPDQAAAVAAVPYDVVSADEARALADANPLSFLRVSRAALFDTHLILTVYPCLALWEGTSHRRHP